MYSLCAPSFLCQIILFSPFFFSVCFPCFTWACFDWCPLQSPHFFPVVRFIVFVPTLYPAYFFLFFLNCTLLLRGHRSSSFKGKKLIQKENMSVSSWKYLIILRVLIRVNKSFFSMTLEIWHNSEVITLFEFEFSLNVVESVLMVKVRVILHRTTLHCFSKPLKEKRRRFKYQIIMYGIMLFKQNSSKN